MGSKINEWIIPKGTTVKIGGMPCALLSDVVVQAAADPLAFVTQPSCGGDCEAPEAVGRRPGGSFPWGG